jgi:uncharacterized protein DUF5666
MVAYGAITGFGSVFVNGIHFDVSRASVTDAGRAATVDDLKVGQMVRIEAEHGADDNGMPRAMSISHDSALRGVVSQIDATAGTLTVLGQTIVVDADTLFDDRISPPSLLGLAVGEAIEVDAFVAADGTLHATRVEKEAANGDLEVTGKIANLDTAAKTFDINSLTVDYSQAELADFPPSGPANDEFVEVRGTSLTGSGVLVATRIALKRHDDPRDHDADQVEVEGLVTRFASLTDFDVNERAVTTTSATRVEGGALADLALGAKIEVEGHVDSAGVLVAEKVSLRHASEILIHASVDAVDTAAGTLQMLGITVHVDTRTRFDDRGPNDDRFLSLAKLSVGDRLEIRATPSGGTNEVLATRLERDSDGSADVELRGDVATRAEPSFTILGVSIATTPASKFEGIAAADLFAGATPLLVDVRGSWDGSTLTAASVAVDADQHEGAED